MRKASLAALGRLLLALRRGLVLRELNTPASVSPRHWSHRGILSRRLARRTAALCTKAEHQLQATLPHDRRQSWLERYGCVDAESAAQI